MYVVIFLAAASRSAEAASITVVWDPNPEANIAGYILYYGTASGAYATTVDVGNTATWTIGGLTDGQQYCFVLRAYDTTGLQSPLSAEVCGIATSAAQLTTPAPGSTLIGSSVQFQWSASARAAGYGLSIGTTPGGVNLFNQNLRTNLNATVTSLPANGSPIYVRLWSWVNGVVWDFTDYTYTAAPCSYILNPSSNSVGVAAMTGTVGITTSSGCAWTSTSNVPWIAVTGGASGAGNSTVSYLVAATTSTSTRTGTITIAGQLFSVTQDAVTPVISPGASAFVGLDRAKQGDWVGTYGVEGFSVVGDVTSYPAYAQVSTSAASWTWSSTTTDVRALQRASGKGRVAATWYGTSFDIDVSLTDGQPHQVAVYSVDWDNAMRVQRFEIVDAATGAVLDTRMLSTFNGGAYLVWNVSGHVKIRVTLTDGVNAVVSGIFFDARSVDASASFVRLDGARRRATGLVRMAPRGSASLAM